MPTLRVLEFIRDPKGVWVLPAALLARLRRDFPSVRFDAPASREDADALLPEVDVVFGYAVRPDNFARASRLRWIQVTSAGVGDVLFPALIDSDVILTNGSGLHSVAMAEHALGMILAFARNLHVARDAQRERRWTQRLLADEGAPFRHVDGSTLGLVGLGAIGHALAPRAAALGMKVVAVRRHPVDPPAPAHAQWDPGRLHEMLELADWVVLAPPLTDETRGLIGAEALRHMKPDALLVNLGRGGLVDEAALVEALSDGRLGGAALDVFAQEPLPPSSPLWDMSNVIVSPHVSGFGPGLWERAVDLFSGNLRAFLEGRPMANVVDKRAGY